MTVNQRVSGSNPEGGADYQAVTTNFVVDAFLFANYFANKWFLCLKRELIRIKTFIVCFFS